MTQVIPQSPFPRKNIKSADCLADKDIVPWMENAKVSSRGYMLGYNDLKDPSVSGLFRLMSKLGDGYMKMQIIRMDFIPD